MQEYRLRKGIWKGWRQVGTIYETVTAPSMQHVIQEHKWKREGEALVLLTAIEGR